MSKAEIDSKFNASVDQLRNIIGGHLGTPHTFAGKEIAGGTHTHEIVDGLCAAVNSAEDVSPPRCPLNVQLQCFIKAGPESQLHSHQNVLLETSRSSGPSGVALPLTFPVTPLLSLARAAKGFDASLPNHLVKQTPLCSIQFTVCTMCHWVYILQFFEVVTSTDENVVVLGGTRFRRAPSMLTVG